jgi:hypothetical protein
MMLPTHALGGMLLALSAAYLAPEFATVALVAGLLGGVFPDLDMYAGHRKSLHYPIYYPVLGFCALVTAGVFPSVPTVAVAVFLLGAALHSVTDAFGGGLELRPWEATSDRAVYDHYRGRWIAPSHWIHYDGSPGDLVLSILLAVPLLVTLDGLFHQAVIVILAVAVVYTALRRRLSRLAAVLVHDTLKPRLPDHLLSYVPARYRDSEPK